VSLVSSAHLRIKGPVRAGWLIVRIGEVRLGADDTAPSAVKTAVEAWDPSPVAAPWVGRAPRSEGHPGALGPELAAVGSGHGPRIPLGVAACRGRRLDVGPLAAVPAASI
jgi:hypothetical protein